MTYGKYLLIKRWKEAGAPESIRRLKPGTRVKLVSSGIDTVKRVGIGKVLLVERGWVDWREIELQSAKG